MTARAAGHRTVKPRRVPQSGGDHQGRTDIRFAFHYYLANSCDEVADREFNAHLVSGPHNGSELAAEGSGHGARAEQLVHGG